MNKLLTLVAAVLLASATQQASAFNRTTTASCPGGLEWTADQSFFVNALDVPAADQTDMFTLVSEITERISFVGGQWLDLSFAGLWPFPSSNSNGINEITKLSIDGTANVLAVATVVYNTSTCEISEADINFDDDDDWFYGVPEDRGKKYFRAQLSVGDEYYARPVALHEFLHTAGLDHTANSYAFLNYGDLPWSNRADEKQIEPLADDREGLRAIYGNSTTETDIAVLNTYYDPTSTNNGAADQQRLCKPSTGTGFSSSKFDDRCGVTRGGLAGTNMVCPGDDLYVRYALTNYSTGSLTVDEELWFSTNLTLNRTAGADKVSPTVHTGNFVGGQSSEIKARVFEVPEDLAHGQSYWVMSFIDSGPDYGSEESTQNNWIPLRTKITVKSAFLCGLVINPKPL